MCAESGVSPGSNCAKRTNKNMGNKIKMCSKLSAMVAMANFQQKKRNGKSVDF
jgi:hypothetical protein